MNKGQKKCASYNFIVPWTTENAVNNNYYKYTNCPCPPRFQYLLLRHQIFENICPPWLFIKVGDVCTAGADSHV